MTDDTQGTDQPSSTQPPMNGEVRAGFISHTELESTDPEATRAWCEEVLGWAFVDPVETPRGEYHLWTFEDGTGGGLQAPDPGEPAGSRPFCEVPNIQEAFDAAIVAGATEESPPHELPGGMGWAARVRAPGGVPIGFWAPE